MATIKMQNVRLSFPNLFQTASFGGESTLKYDCTLILDKKEHKKNIVEIQKVFKSLADERWKGKMPPEDKLCLRDGDDTEREELQGCYSMKASSKRRPLVLDRDKSPLTEEDNVIYAGCFVNAIVSIWLQDNQFGRRLNASLEGIQFTSAGEPFGAPSIDADEFDAFGEADDNQEAMTF